MKLVDSYISFSFRTLTSHQVIPVTWESLIKCNFESWAESTQSKHKWTDTNHVSPIDLSSYNQFPYHINGKHSQLTHLIPITSDKNTQSIIYNYSHQSWWLNPILTPIYPHQFTLTPIHTHSLPNLPKNSRIHFPWQTKIHKRKSPKSQVYKALHPLHNQILHAI